MVNNIQIDYRNINLIFSTLWSKISPPNEWNIQQRVSDFFQIKKDGAPFLPSDFSDLHRKSFSFLESAIKKDEGNKTIIVTHHVPTFMNYQPQYKTDSQINEAFATELFDFIEGSEAAYWIYGHHHCNIDEFTIGKTKMLTNQLGYVCNGEHTAFRRDSVIEI